MYKTVSDKQIRSVYLFCVTHLDVPLQLLFPRQLKQSCEESQQTVFAICEFVYYREKKETTW